MIYTLRNSKLNSFIVIIVMTLTFGSCSNDDDNGNEDCLPGVATLTTSALGEYTGTLSLNATEVINPTGTATIAESGCKTYTVSFSNDVPSIADIRFIATSNGEVFTYVNGNATTTVSINEEGNLNIAKTDTPVIAFNGSK